MKIRIGKKIFEPARIFCIGKNYVDHIKEMDEKLPESPVIFMKPVTSLVPAGGKIKIPSHGKVFHYETELVLIIGKKGRPKNPKEAIKYIAGFSLGLDMTVRDIQGGIIKNGLPWELCKSFDYSAPLGRFVPASKIKDPGGIKFCGKLNGKIVQCASTELMIFPVGRLVHAVSLAWELRPGDLVYTGTPCGIGPVKNGDVFTAEADEIGSFSWKVER